VRAPSADDVRQRRTQALTSEARQERERRSGLPLLAGRASVRTGAAKKPELVRFAGELSADRDLRCEGTSRSGSPFREPAPRRARLGCAATRPENCLPRGLGVLIRVEGSIEIARPPEAVWAFVSDPRNDPRWGGKVKSVQPAGAGRWRVLHKPVAPRPAIELTLDHLELARRTDSHFTRRTKHRSSKSSTGLSRAPLARASHRSASSDGRSCPESYIERSRAECAATCAGSFRRSNASSKADSLRRVAPAVSIKLPR
jgi:Polyketide cyclase / dehydrase and lipid transport